MLIKQYVPELDGIGGWLTFLIVTSVIGLFILLLQSAQDPWAWVDIGLFPPCVIRMIMKKRLGGNSPMSVRSGLSCYTLVLFG